MGVWGGMGKETIARVSLIIWETKALCSTAPLAAFLSRLSGELLGSLMKLTLPQKTVM